MTITLGWWAIPTVATAALIVWGILPMPNQGGDYAGFGNAAVAIIQLLGGIIVVLAMWLAWAVLA